MLGKQFSIIASALVGTLTHVRGRKVLDGAYNNMLDMYMICNRPLLAKSEGVRAPPGSYNLGPHTYVFTPLHTYMLNILA